MGISKTVLEEIRQKYADGMQMHEIAQMLGIPESTVRNIIMKGDDQKTKE